MREKLSHLLARSSLCQGSSKHRIACAPHFHSPSTCRAHLARPRTSTCPLSVLFAGGSSKAKEV
jgi:hypothetical protein